MDEDATWYGSIDLRADHIVLDGFPALRERGTGPRSFRPMSELLLQFFCGSSVMLEAKTSYENQVTMLGL